MSLRTFGKGRQADGREGVLTLRQRRHRGRAGQAREAAGDRDVRIAGGGATILEYLNAGLIGEFSIALSPALFGSGIPLYEGVHASRVALEQIRAEPTQRVPYSTYAVRER